LTSPKKRELAVLHDWNVQPPTKKRGNAHTQNYPGLPPIPIRHPSVRTENHGYRKTDEKTSEHNQKLLLVFDGRKAF